MIYLVTDSFPRQQARTQRFTLGVPRSFQVSPDGGRVAFLRSRGGADPVTCLWVLDVASGEERLIADPAEISPGSEADPEEKARRERSRERASGIVSFAADAGLRTVAFVLGGRVYAADLTAGTGPARVRDLGARALDTLAPAADPRPDPAGRLVAYVHAGALRVIDLARGQDAAVTAPGQGEEEVTFGLAEFVAAEEMGRHRGYWWAPDGTALLAARVDERPVRRWYIADPANPGRPAAAVRYPVAGTPNADVSLVLARAGCPPAPVAWDRAAFPYLVTVCWDGVAPETPLIVVQTRDQREMRVLAVNPATGATSVVRVDTDPHWLEIVPGVPARTAGGRIVWTADAGGARRLLVATAADLAAGTAEPVTPATLQVREILGVDGDTVLFAASEAEPTEIGVWAYCEGHLEQVSDGSGVSTGQRAGGTTVITTRNLESAEPTVRVLRGPRAEAGSGTPGERKVARLAVVAERPLLPEPRPDIFAAGERGIRTALLLPSWHRPGSARLPVLMDPYGGPHGQQVLASQAIFLTSQWFAEQGFAVVVADGRGTPGRGPAWERTVAGDLARPAVEDQVEALRAAAARCADLDLDRVGIRGWSFGGYLAALAVVRRPDVFHAAVSGAPVTDWRMYDTHATERYLGHPDTDSDHYDASSVLDDARELSRPLLLIHGLADDNVAVAHTLRLSSVLLAAGRPHSVLPLSGITHMPVDEQVAENMLLLQLDFLCRALGVPAAGSAR
jgi:dipeptidyl-peptidase-4